MAAVTVSKPDRSLIAALGPIMLEFVFVTTPSNDDTYVSKLANPSGAVLFPLGDAGGTYNGSASLSGKTVTLHDPKAGIDHLLVVFGNGLV